MLKRLQQEKKEVEQEPSYSPIEMLITVSGQPMPRIKTQSKIAVATELPANEEFAIWQELNSHYQELLENKNRGLVTEEDMMEILSQHQILIERSYELLDYHGKTVVVCAGDLFIGENLNEAVAKAQAKHGDKPYYAETIDLSEFS